MKDKKKIPRKMFKNKRCPNCKSMYNDGVWDYCPFCKVVLG